MAMKIHVDVVSAEAEIFSGQAEVVYAPAELGEVGILPRHAPMITRLKPGEVRVEVEPGQTEYFYVSGGMLEVQPHVVTVLADTALRARDLDEAAALEAKRRAESVLATQKAEFEYAKAESELADAVAKLKTIEKLRRIKGG